MVPSTAAGSLDSQILPTNARGAAGAGVAAGGGAEGALHAAATRAAMAAISNPFMNAARSSRD